MRFNVGKKIDPKVGDVRKIRKFLLFPRRIGDQIVWLETVIKSQIYSFTTRFDGVNYFDIYYWETLSYELIDRDHMEYL
jgi:hypothetical protein